MPKKRLRLKRSQRHRPPPAASGASARWRRRLDRRGLPAAGCCAPNWAHAAGPIKMGIATDITGADRAVAATPTGRWRSSRSSRSTRRAAFVGRPIELYLEDTASDPKIAVGNVRKLIQERKVDVVLGGITSAMRQAIKDPIVNRGRTLYIYPQLYEGQECTKYLFCTGPTPAQQCDKLIPYLIKTLGKKRFAMPSANYVWPQLLNKYARKVIEANGGEVVFEEYYPLDQAGIFRDHRQDPRRQGRLRVQHRHPARPAAVRASSSTNSGFQKNGGVLTCVYYDENLLNYHPAQEMEGLYSCLDYFQAVDDPFSKQLQAGLREEVSRHQVPVHRRLARRPACIAA